MPKAIMYFPAGFLWGSATAAYCVEGASPASDWSEWGQQPEGVLDESKPGRACEWWAGRWSEDFDRAQETHQTALRLSVEWARVQPEPDRWDEPALDRYREMLIGLNQRGISPLVCLHHNTNPLWFANGGAGKMSKRLLTSGIRAARGSAESVLRAVGDLQRTKRVRAQPTRR